jgi:amino acid permease
VFFLQFAVWYIYRVPARIFFCATQVSFYYNKFYYFQVISSPIMPFWDKNEKTGDTISQSPSDPFTRDSHDEGIVHDNADHLQRRLGNRQIQLIAIGGSIGTALFVSIGGGLARGGPGSLLLAYGIYSCFLALVNNCIAEMTILYPVEGGFIRLAGKFVDEAVGFMAGWNFFLYEQFSPMRLPSSDVLTCLVELC